MADDPTLSPAWAAWAAENLLRGVPRHEVMETLVAQGLSPTEGTRALDELERSPAFVAALPLAREARRGEMIRRLLTEHAETLPSPGEIPRRPYAGADDFYERHYATLSPVVLTGLLRDWPALSRWTPAWLKSRFGDVEVAAVYGRAQDPSPDLNTPSLTRAVRLGDFVDDVLAAGESNDLYLVAQARNIERDALHPLWDDVRWDPALLDPARRAGAAALWFGPGGTVTSMHHDTANILLCQVYGEKRVTLAAPWEPALEPLRRGVYADFDPESDAPPAADVRLRRATLTPGDALFIPAGWWQHVRAMSVSISLGLTNFTRDNLFNWFRPGELR
jgi:hypothetical protein